MRSAWKSGPLAYLNPNYYHTSTSLHIPNTLRHCHQHDNTCPHPALPHSGFHLNSHIQQSQWTSLASNYFWEVQNSDTGRDINSARSLINDILLSSIWHLYSDSFLLRPHSAREVDCWNFCRCISETPQVRTDVLCSPPCCSIFKMQITAQIRPGSFLVTGKLSCWVISHSRTTVLCHF